MTYSAIDQYLQALKRELWMRGLTDADLMEEIENHLLEDVEKGLGNGLNPLDAQRQAIERFGSIKIIGASFEKERNDLMQKILLGLGVLAGLFLALLDALPGWDDTGVLAGGLLLSSGLLALLGYRRPWLLALAVGLWIPLHDIFLSHDMRMLLVLIFPVVGAYAGWAVHLFLRRTFRPA
jgi:hypothetical protein